MDLRVRVRLCTLHQTVRLPGREWHGWTTFDPALDSVNIGTTRGFDFCVEEAIVPHGGRRPRGRNRSELGRGQSKLTSGDH
jgi:hypothetical protein